MTNDKNNAFTARLFLWLGPMVMALICVVEPPSGMSVEAWRTAGLAFWLASWWITEAVPIPAASLLPLVVSPLLGIASSRGCAICSPAHLSLFRWVSHFNCHGTLGLTQAYCP